MAIFYVRASNDLPTPAGQVSSGKPLHMPHPGYKYDATDAANAAALHLAANPSLPAGTKLVVVPDSALAWFDVAPITAVPGVAPAYT